MRRLQCALLAAVAAIGFASIASAADMPVKARPMAPQPVAYNWTGFYIGVNAGVARSLVDYGLSTPGGAFPFFLPGDDTAIAANGSGNFNSRDFTFGGQVGYNHQIGKALLGVEVDWGRWGLGNSSSVTAPTPFAGNQTTITSVDARSLATLRGRLGYVFDRSMFYVTGGAAYSKINFAQTTSFTGVPTVDTASNSVGKWGWTLGGGGEYALDAHWLVKAEYLYVGFGSMGFNTTATSPYGAPDTVPFSHSVNVRAHIARLGLNYKF